MKVRPIHRFVLTAYVFILATILLPESATAVTANEACLTAQPGAFSIIGSVWGTTTNPLDAGPGDQNIPLTVTFLYNVQCVATSVQVSLNPLPNGFTDVNGQTNTTAYTTNVTPNSIFQLVFPLNVSPSATIGAYTFPVNVTWNTSEASNLTQSTSFTVRLKGSTQLDFSAIRTSLIAGQVNNVTLVLSNVGTGNASQIATSVTGPASLSLLNRLPTVENLSASLKVRMSLEVYVPSADSGSAVTLSFSSVYLDAYGYKRTSAENLGFMVQTPIQASLLLSVSPNTLVAGAVSNLTVSISNNGASTISGFTATFAFATSGVTWLGPNVFQGGSLSPGQSVTIYTQAYEPANAASSVLLQVSIAYYDGSGSFHQESRNLGLLSRGLVKFEATGIAVTPETISSGDIFSTTVTLTNVGTTVASAVTADAEPPSGFRVFGSRTIFIGDMQVSTPTPFTITFQVANGTTPGRYQISIRLTFVDNLRNNQSVGLRVPVLVGPPLSSNPTTGGIQNAGSSTFGIRNLGMILPILIAAVAMFGTGYAVGRRRSRKK